MESGYDVNNAGDFEMSTESTDLRQVHSRPLWAVGCSILNIFEHHE